MGCGSRKQWLCSKAAVQLWQSTQPGPLPQGVQDGWRKVFGMAVVAAGVFSAYSLMLAATAGLMLPIADKFMPGPNQQEPVMLPFIEIINRITRPVVLHRPSCGHRLPALSASKT